MKPVNFEKMEKAIREAHTKIKPLKRAYENAKDTSLPYLTVHQDIITILMAIRNNLCDYYTEAEKINIFTNKKLDKYVKSL